MDSPVSNHTTAHIPERRASTTPSDLEAPMDLSDTPADDPAPALGRGIAILRHLELNGSCSLEQLARHFRWPKASLLRLTESLRRAGVVLRDPATKRYHSLVQLVAVAATLAPSHLSGQPESQLLAITHSQDRTPCLV